MRRLRRIGSRAHENAPFGGRIRTIWVVAWAIVMVFQVVNLVFIWTTGEFAPGTLVCAVLMIVLALSGFADLVRKSQRNTA